LLIEDPAPASPTNVTLPNDQDLGSSGAALLKPVGQTINSTGFEVFAAGKEGVAYVLDPTLMSNGTSGADTHDPCSTSAGVQPLQCFQPIALSLGTGNVVKAPALSRRSGVATPPRMFWKICCSSPVARILNCGTGGGSAILGT